MGIVSGRGLEDLKGMVRLPGLLYAGTGGLELELEGAVRIPEGGERARHVMENLAATLCAALEPYSGAWVERKSLGLTLHYRSVVPGQVEEPFSTLNKNTKPP